MIKAVIFDLGRVIVPFDFTIGYRQLESLCGIPAAEIPGRIAKTGLAVRLESGQIAAPDFYREFAEALELNIGFEEFQKIWCSVFLPHALTPEWLLAAVSKTHRLILLSNTNSIHFDMLREAYPVLRHFHAWVLSYEVGAMKPAPEIYRHAIALAGCAPEECFFTDDIAEYVEAAKREGIDAVQFQSGEQIELELRARGVL
ncbi:MAG TPA: HAD family phosphatase [Bryobacteraceae bacterium]|nr:HAD family phosphatase [Bryobacteraceae bacterium]